MKKFLKIAAVATAATLIFAACGSDSDSASDTTMAGATDTTMAGETPATDGFTLPNFTPMEGATPVDCAPKDGAPIKAAWVYVGPINDGGWTQAHHEGLKAVEAAMGDKVVTTYKENIPEGPEVAATLDQLVADGNNIIFGTSFGFQDAFVAAGEKYPNVCFEFETGYKISQNVSQAYGAGEDGDYLAGMAAGAATKSGKIGFVAPFAIPEVIRGVNAFTLGAQSINPAVTVQVVWVNTWFDPAIERKAAESLIAAGVDTIASAQDSPATGEAAKVKGIPWVGYDSDQSANYPDIWLTANTYHWGAYETARVQAAAAGTWISGDYYGGLNDGFIKLANFGKLVSADTQAKIATKMEELSAASRSQFTGPIMAQDGTEKIAAGATASHGDLMGMDYLVKGVLGDLPKD